jgi:cobalt/nickel transport protein
MTRIRTRVFLALAFAVAVGLAVFASPYASSSPDGLEQVAGSKGFLADGRPHTIQERSPVPDYAFPGIHDPRLATALAGLFGTLLVALVGISVVEVVRRRTSAA